MAKAECVHSTLRGDLPVHTRHRRQPLREYIVEAAAIATILISSAFIGCLLVTHAEGKIAHRCALDLRSITQ
jgi:hypothetical protein